MRRCKSVSFRDPLKKAVLVWSNRGLNVCGFVYWWFISGSWHRQLLGFWGSSRVLEYLSPEERCPAGKRFVLVASMKSSKIPAVYTCYISLHVSWKLSSEIRSSASTSFPLWHCIFVNALLEKALFVNVSDHPVIFFDIWHFQIQRHLIFVQSFILRLHYKQQTLNRSLELTPCCLTSVTTFKGMLKCK